MCGRFTLTKVDQLPSFFGLDEQPEVEARYNIAPRQDVLVVLHNKPRIAKFMRWGFSPNLTARSRCSLLINARAETVDRKVTFGYPFRTQRCLVPADGFYEWSSGHSSRKPFYFHLANRGLFAFAGLWNVFGNSKGGEFDACTIITTPSNDFIGDIHDRMPVILDRSVFKFWLNKDSKYDLLKSLLKPYPSDQMERVAVSSEVNRINLDSSKCLNPPKENFHNLRLFN